MKNLLKKVVYSFPSSVFLMFHHVLDNPNCKKSDCVLNTNLFYKQISTMDRFQGIDSFFEKNVNKKTVVTFDDGLEDLYTIAYPFLKEHNIPFVAFVVTDFLDQEGYITTKQLMELSKDPLVTIGSHGVSHSILTKLNSKEKKKIEIVDSKKILEDILGKEVKYFAYSHGQFDKDCLKFVKEYKKAFSATGLPYNIVTKKIMGDYQIPRVNIDNKVYEKSNNKINSYNY